MAQQVEAWGNLLEFPDDMSHDEMAAIIRKNESTLNPDYKPKDIGFLGTLKEGAKGTLRNLGASVDTLQGDEGEVVSASRAAAEAPKDPALSALLADIEQRKKILGKDPSWLDAAKAVGGAALSNPKGAGLLLAEQLPNSAAALAAGGAGALAGSAFGPVGTIAGGLAGLFGANTALETGGKAIEAAADGSFSPEEQSRVLKEGAIKGGVITGVDAATLGLTNFITGTTRRAVERATVKTLADHGVDVTSKAAVEAAAKNPVISESVKAAQELAAKATTTLGQRVAQVGGATGLETVGEGAGDYLGEMAATGKADKVDAVIEAFSSLGQSAGEIAFTAAKNKAKLETILGKPVTEVSDRVLRYTADRGGERAKAAAQAELARRAEQGVDPEIANAPESTSEAVDRIIATGREKANEIRSARADAIQDSIFDEEENAGENAPAAQSQPLQDAPTPEPIQTLNSQINVLAEGRKPGVLLTPNEPMPDALPEGVRAAEIPGRGILLYRDEAALRDALDGRMGEALGYGIDEKPADATHVVTARDANGTVIQDVATDGRPEVERAAATVAGQNGTVETRPIQEAMGERNAEGSGADTTAGAIGDKGRKEDSALAASKVEPKTLRADITQGRSATYWSNEMSKLRDIKPRPIVKVFGKNGPTPEQKTDYDERVKKWNTAYRKASAAQKVAMERDNAALHARQVTANESVSDKKNQASPAQQPSSREAGNDSVANEAQAVHPIRPLVESLIKRRAAAKQSGKERSLNNAIARAKEVLEGKRTDAALESKWFRVQAAGMKNADAETAEILRKIGEAVKSGKLEPPNTTGKGNGSGGTTESRSRGGVGDASGGRSVQSKKLSEQLSKTGISGENQNRENALAGTISRNEGRVADKNESPKFSRSETERIAEVRKRLTTASDKAKQATPRGGLVVSDAHEKLWRSITEAVVQKITSDWKNAPGIIVVDDMNDPAVPDEARRENEAQMSHGATGTPEAFLFDGKVYILASEMHSLEDIIRVLSHESFGHVGLRGKFKEELKPILRQIIALRPADMDRKAKQYGLPIRNEDGKPRLSDEKLTKNRLKVAEEILAEMAQTNPQLGFVRRAIAAIRAWFRKNVPGFQDMMLTDDEIINSYIIPAREFVVNGEGGSAKGGSMFSRAPNIGTDAFRRWFGKSKVVGKDGNPMPMYHGTDADIHVFAPGEADAIFLTPDPGFANRFAMGEASPYGHKATHGPNIMRVYVKAENPFDPHNKSHRKALIDKMFQMTETYSQGDGEKALVLDGERTFYTKDVLDAGLVNQTSNWNILELKETQDAIKANGHDGFYVTEDGIKNLAVYNPHQIKSATGNRGTFDPNNPDILFSRKPSGSNASWDAPEPSRIDNLIYSLQNRHIDLKRVTEAVRESAGQLAEKFNAYLQEELFHGRTAKRTKDFVNEELKPLIAGLKLRGLSIDELDKYLHARHAQEANALIAQRDPNMPDGGSGMTNQEAKDYFKGLDPEKKRKLEQVAKKVDDIIAGTRDLYLSYGLIDQATYDSWGSMFKHYVPLMREDKDGGMGIGQGFSIKGKEAKHRTGSRRKVVDILANIALQREKAIVRGEKNRVAVSLAGLAKLNPNPDFWTFDKVPTERVMNEATGLVEERPVPGFKDRDNVVVAKIRDSKGNVIERAVIFNEKGAHKDRALRMAAALKNLDVDQLGGLMGVSAMITRYFASINTQYNPVFGVVNLVRDLQGSMLNLSSTPIAGQRMKVLAQVIPAIQAIYASSRGERKGKQASSSMAALWDEMQLEGGMTGYRDLFKTSEDRAKAIQRELDPTAWMNSGLGKIFTAGGMLKVPLAVAQKKAGWLFDWLSDYNQTLEGATRLAAYKVALDNGLSKQQAASVAKNSTVNFNRRGQIGQQAGALYAFFNAAMQGTARIGETMTTMDKGDINTLKFSRAGKKIIAGGLTLGVMQALALAAAGFDDDEPPEFVRERSLIIPIGDKKYIAIPMPLGFHVIPNIGRISTEFALGGFKNKAERTAQLFMLFAEAFNPIGSSSTLTQTLSPTATDPLVAIAENKDWTGKPIAKEDFNKLSPTPGFSRNKDTASDPAKWIAEAINTISGGNKYVPGLASPTADQIDYLWGQATGGVGREASKLNQTISSIGSGEDLPPHKIPLVGRFFGDSASSSSQGNKFYSNLKRINEVEAELKGRTKDRLPVDEFKSENPEYRLITAANYTERAVSNLRRRKSDLLEKDAPKEQVKAVEDRITVLMKRLNERVKELRTAP